MFDHADLKTVLVWVSVAIILLALFVPFLVPHDPDWPPSLGDWGDYIGGMGTLLAIIWAIGGYFCSYIDNQKNQEDIKEQLDISRSAVGALSQIAAKMGKDFEETKATAMPRFVSLGSLAPASVPTSRFIQPITPTGYIELRNDGAGVVVYSVESQSENWKARLQRTGFIRPGEHLKILFETTGKARIGGPISAVVRFETRLAMSGWFNVQASTTAEQIIVGEPKLGEPSVKL